MAGNTFTQKIKVKVDGAEKASKGVGKVSAGMKKLALAAGGAAAAFFGARMLIDGVKQSIELFKRQELAEKKLEIALGKTSKALLNQATALQQSTMFGDEAIIEAQALIAAFVKEEDAIMAATEATLDLAAAKGMDLVTAADLVSKTLGSSTNALSRYGIQVEGAVGSQERLNSLTGNLADVFGGQATEQTETLAGAMEQMSNSAGDVAEKIGEALAPTIINIANWLSDAAVAVGDWVSSWTESDLETSIREIQAMGEEALVLQKILSTGHLRELERNLKSTSSAEELAGRIEIYEERRSKALQKRVGVEKDLADETGEISDHEKEVLKGKLKDLKEEDEERKARIDGIKEELKIIKKIGEEKENLQEIERQIAEENGQIYATDEERQEARKNFNEDFQKKVEEWAEKKGKLTKDEIADLNQQFAAEDKLENLREQQVNTAMAIGAAQVHAGQAAADAAGAYITAEIQSALATMIKKAFAEAGFFAGLGAVATAGATGSLMAQTIKSVTAAEGFEGIVDEPTLFLAGEEGPEYVDVEPTMNEGAGRGGANITITGNVLSRDFIEDEAVPMIREALRKGGDIGIG